jgi:hypothetical protein
MSIRGNPILGSAVRKSPLRVMSGHERIQHSPSPERSERPVPKLLLRKTSHIRSILCTECIQKKEVPAVIERIGETEESGEIKQFIDPEGHEHIHDMSTITAEYSCSNHHRWSVKESKNKCWCLHYQSSPLSSGSYSPRESNDGSNDGSLVFISPRRSVYPKGGSFISFPVETQEDSLRHSPNRTRSSHN